MPAFRRGYFESTLEINRLKGAVDGAFRADTAERRLGEPEPDRRNGGAPCADGAPDDLLDLFLAIVRRGWVGPVSVARRLRADP